MSKKLKKLEWYTQGFNINLWLPCEEVSYNVLLQQTELKWSLDCLQLHGSITRRLVAAANELQEVTDAIDTARRECYNLLN